MHSAGHGSSSKLENDNIVSVFMEGARDGVGINLLILSLC